MKAIPGLVLLILAGTALADPVKIMDPCRSTDFECVKKEASDFFRNSAVGIPELGTAAIDPLGSIPAFDVVFGEDIGVSFKLSNLNVKGLKDQKLFYVNLNVQTRQFLLALETNLVIEADVAIDYIKESKTFTGHFATPPTTIFFTVRCNLDIIKNDAGVNRYKVGPEKITYEIISTPQLDWSNELKQQLDSDEAWKKQSEDIFKKFSNQTIAEIVKKALTYPVSNMREAGKYLKTDDVFIE